MVDTSSTNFKRKTVALINADSALSSLIRELDEIPNTDEHVIELLHIKALLSSAQNHILKIRVAIQNQLASQSQVKGVDLIEQAQESQKEK